MSARPRSHRFAGMLLSVALALPLFATACTSSGPPPDVIRLGLMAAFNGPLQYFGNAYDKGVRMYADEVGDHGGILQGKRIEVVSCDTERRSEKEVTCVEKLVTKDKVSAIIADNSDGIRSPRAMQTIEKYKIPVMLPAQVLPESEMSGAKSPFLFGDTQKRDYAETLLRFMRDERGIREVGVLHATDFYGDEGLKEIQGAFDKMGMQPTTVQSFAVGDSDMTIQAGKLKDSGAQGVIVWGLGSDAARGVESMKRIGYKPQIAGPPGLYISTYRVVLQEDSNDTIMAAPHAKGDLPLNIQEVTWIFRFYLKYGFNFFTINGKSAPDWPILEMNAYKAARYLGLAWEKTGSTDGDTVRNIFESGQRFESLGNQVRWTRESHLSKTDPESETWIARFTNGHVLFDWEPRAPKAFEWCRRDVEESMTEGRLEDIGRQNKGGLLIAVLREIRTCFDVYEAEFRARLGDQFEVLRNLIDGVIADPGRANELAEGAARSDPFARQTGTPTPLASARP